MTDHLTRVRDALEAAGIEVNETRPLPTDLGQQLRCAGGQVVVCYNTGKLVIQGKDAERVKAILAGLPAVPKPAPVDKPVPGTAAVSAVPVPATPSPVQSRLPPRWTTEPWDGSSVPW